MTKMRSLRRRGRPPFDPVGERIERANHVISVKSEVGCEVVTRSRRNADVGDVMLHCDRRDQRLRPVAAGHPDDIGTARDGPLGQLVEVVITPEQQGLDIAPSCLLGKVEALRLPATGVGVDDQHAPLRWLHGRASRRAMCIGVGVTHRISGHEAEQHKHSDQHRQRHLWSYAHMKRITSARTTAGTPSRRR